MNTIELILDNGRASLNVLCNGYTMMECSHPSVDHLCTRAWDILLSRIGDPLMVYLLCHSSIFIPLQIGGLHQVTGLSMKMLYEYSNVVGAQEEPTKREGIESRGEFQMKRMRAEDGGTKEKTSVHVHEPQKLWMHGKEKRVCLPGGINCSNPTNNFKSNEGSNACTASDKNSQMVAPICFSCLVLHTSQRVSSGYHVLKHHIYYSTNPVSSVFPKNHILNRLKANDLGALSLMENIFGLPRGTSTSFELIRSCDYCSAESKSSFYSALALVKSLLRKVKRCPYKSLLQKHCPYSILEGVRKNEEIPRAASNVSYRWSRQFDSYCTHHQVVSFIWSVIRRIIPLDCLGDSSTWRILRKKIWRIVNMHRFETLSLQECCQGLEASKYPFLSLLCPVDCVHNYQSLQGQWMDQFEGKTSSITTHAKEVLSKKLFQGWICWFFTHFVVSLLRSHFYVTDKASKKHEVFYYHKDVWESIVTSSMSCLKGQYDELNDASIKAAAKDGSFCFSKGRVLLKPKDVRLVANFSAPCKIEICSQVSAPKNCSALTYRLMQKQVKKDQKTSARWFKPVNSILNDLLFVLKIIKFEYPHKLGASVFDYNDVHKKLLSFLSEVRSCSENLHDLYIVVADVSKAFDSIDQNLLISIMKDVIEKDVYPLRRYLRTVSNKSSIAWLHHQVPFLEGVINFDLREHSLCARISPMNDILIDQGSIKFIKGRDLQCLLCKLLKRNMLRVGKNYYVQKIGISQGSSVSPLLCAFYYGHLERTVIFPNLEKGIMQTNTMSYDNSLMDSVQNSKTLKSVQSNVRNESEVYENENSKHFLLMRFIDDFLFISTSKAQADTFYDMMRKGFTKYNCFMNNDKYGLNFDVVQDRVHGSRVYTGLDGVSFLYWSGLLLNCRTLEVQADYTRYLDTHMRSCITIPKDGATCDSLEGRLRIYMKPKCHPIFYDYNINSAATVRLNIYQSFLVGAMKFHCYVHSTRIVKCNDSHKFLVIIKRSIRSFYNMINKRVHNMEARFNICPVLHLRESEVTWLGLSAYLRILRKKQSQYSQLLSLLRSEIASYSRVASESNDLKYAVDDSHSSVFWKIKF